MSKRLSQFYGMDIYTEQADYVGKVEDVILNLDKGEIMRLTLRSFKKRRLPSDDVKKILQEESIAYSEIERVGDIIICKKDPRKAKKRDKFAPVKKAE